MGRTRSGLWPVPRGRPAGERLGRVGELSKGLEKPTHADGVEPPMQRARVRRLFPARQNSVESPSQVLAKGRRSALPDRGHASFTSMGYWSGAERASTNATMLIVSLSMLICGLLEQLLLRAKADQVTRRRLGSSPTMLSWKTYRGLWSARTAGNEGQQNTLDHNVENIGKHPVARPLRLEVGHARDALSYALAIYKNSSSIGNAAQGATLLVLHAPAQFR